MTHSAARPDFGGVAASLRNIVRTYGRNRLELEFRLGHRIAGRFVPGVSENSWTALKAALDSSTAFEVAVTNTRELICDDGSGGKYVIPEAVAAQSAAAQSAAAPKPYWMHKRRLLDVDMDTEASPWCCRTSVSLEEMDGTNKAPPAHHKFERQKHRWSYKHRCWSIDLTRVVSNLPHQLDNDGVSFEVEFELVDTSELYARTLHDLLEWGWKLVSEACDTMARRTGTVSAT